MLLAKKGSSHDPDCVLTSVQLGKDPSSATTTTSVVEKSREERDNLDRGFPDKKVTCAERGKHLTTEMLWQDAVPIGIFHSVSTSKRRAGTTSSQRSTHSPRRTNGKAGSTPNSRATKTGQVMNGRTSKARQTILVQNRALEIGLTTGSEDDFLSRWHDCFLDQCQEHDCNTKDGATERTTIQPANWTLPRLLHFVFIPFRNDCAHIHGI